MISSSIDLAHDKILALSKHPKTWGIKFAFGNFPTFKSSEVVEDFLSASYSSEIAC